MNGENKVEKKMTIWLLFFFLYKISLLSFFEEIPVISESNWETWRLGILNTFVVKDLKCKKTILKARNWNTSCCFKAKGR